MDEFEEHEDKKSSKDIKSFYILKLILSFLSEKRKLKMIMYNKELQNSFLVNINDYKNKSGKYKIDGKNGKGKEFILNTNILIFEGEYLKGERNGKGKEYYDDGKLKFEGEYLNGKRWNGKGYNKQGHKEFEIKNGNGKVREYSYFGDYEFEGSFLNGERNGKGKEYYEEDEVKFFNEYLKKRRNEDEIKIDSCKKLAFKIQGKAVNYEGYNKDLLKFDGEYLNGERNGKGIEYYQDHILKFIGEYLNGKRNGKGKEFYDDGKLKFDGEYFKDKKWNGKGYNKNGEIVFEIKNGNGKGKEYYDDGELKFEGEYLNGKRNGKGKEYYDNYEGEYLNGKRNGKGKEYYDNGNLKFEGEYLNGERGDGKVYKAYKNNSIIEFCFNDYNVFERPSLKEEIIGKEKEYYDDGELKFEGEYLNGKRNGKGKEYYDNGKLKFEGEYLNGKRWNGKIFYKKGYKEIELKEGKESYDDDDFSIDIDDLIF